MAERCRARWIRADIDQLVVAKLHLLPDAVADKVAVAHDLGIAPFGRVAVSERIDLDGEAINRPHPQGARLVARDLHLDRAGAERMSSVTCSNSVRAESSLFG